jgi:UDP-glucose 4-epimerase
MVSKSALVTGAYGFVGRHIAQRLAAAGYSITGIGHGSWGRDEWRRWGIAEWHSADVNVETLTTYGGEPNVVVHCAGSGSVAFSMTHPLQDYQRSVATTVSVLEFLRLHHPDARLVLPSSAGVYGFAHELPIRTDAALRPVSPYGLHKSIAESLCASYARHFGVRCALVRLFSVFGIGIRKQLLWDACSKISVADLAFSGTGDETRDWVHIEDAAELMYLATEYASEACPIVNGGVGLAVRNRELIEALCADFGIAQHRLQFSGRVRPGDPLHYVADCSGARAWGWVPKRQWRREVTAYVEWFRSGAP